MWTDSETDVDYLNFAGVAETVAELIKQAKARPISIGIAGAWGVGKSSMIRLVQGELERRDADKSKFLFVNFNAWLYQGYDDARAALMDVIGEALLQETEKRKTGIEKTFDFLKRVRISRVVKLVANMGAVAAGLPPPALIDTVVDAATRMAAGQGAAEDAKKLEEAAKKAAEGGAGFLAQKAAYSPPQEINALRKSFEDALKELNVTLVVLIDDLDRCLPETTISTLEAIRLFLFLPRTAFVIAADDQMIRHAVKKHFSGIEDELVTNYFDKLIQIAIRVPPLGTAEVRAYMMLLYVENSDLKDALKEHLRKETIAQLQKSWQGKHVNVAFFQALQSNLPADLLSRLESADRLAPMMATAARIQGNPRLIKRFLNMLAIRMTIARSHGVTVDEQTVTKMLLLERCAPPKIFSDIAAEVMRSADGHAASLGVAEKLIRDLGEGQMSPPWNEPFLQDWLRLPPELGTQDLRGVLYVSREHAPLVTPEDRLSPEAVEILTAVASTPAMSDTAAIRESLTKLTPPERATIMQNILSQARRESAWGAPPILTACLVLADIDAAQAELLAAFLLQIPSPQLQPSIVPKISAKRWSSKVFEEWKSRDDLPRLVKNAISQLTTVR
jgi:predicted KAP-like P-loop ATPase